MNDGELTPYQINAIEILVRRQMVEDSAYLGIQALDMLTADGLLHYAIRQIDHYIDHVRLATGGTVDA